MRMKVSVLLIALMLCVVGCKKSEPATEEGGAATGTTETATAATPEASAAATTEATVSAEIPADFPKDVPIYAGATVTSASKSEDGSFLVKLETSDDPAKAAETVGADMTKAGWEQTTSMAMGTASMLKYKMGDRQVSSNISKLENGKTEIAMTVGIAAAATETTGAAGTTETAPSVGTSETMGGETMGSTTTETVPSAGTTETMGAPTAPTTEATAATTGTL